MLTNTPITVYNAYYDPNLAYDVYQKTTLSDVWFYSTLKTQAGENGLLSAEEYTVQYEPTEVEVTDNRTYLDYHAFAKLPPDQLPLYFTFSPGDKVVRGAVDFEVLPATKGHTITDLEKTYPQVFDVLSANYRGEGTADEPYMEVKGG